MLAVLRDGQCTLGQAYPNQSERDCARDDGWLRREITFDHCDRFAPLRWTAAAPRSDRPCCSRRQIAYERLQSSTQPLEQGEIVVARLRNMSQAKTYPGQPCVRRAADRALCLIDFTAL